MSLWIPIATMTCAVRTHTQRFTLSAIATLFVLSLDPPLAAARRSSTPPSDAVADTAADSAAGSLTFGFAVIAVLVIAALVIRTARKNRSW